MNPPGLGGEVKKMSNCEKAGLGVSIAMALGVFLFIWHLVTSGPHIYITDVEFTNMTKKVCHVEVEGYNSFLLMPGAVYHKQVLFPKYTLPKTIIVRWQDGNGDVQGKGTRIWFYTQLPDTPWDFFYDGRNVDDLWLEDSQVKRHKMCQSRKHKSLCTEHDIAVMLFPSTEEKDIMIIVGDIWSRINF